MVLSRSRMSASATMQQENSAPMNPHSTAPRFTSRRVRQASCAHTMQPQSGVATLRPPLYTLTTSRHNHRQVWRQDSADSVSSKSRPSRPRRGRRLRCRLVGLHVAVQALAGDAELPRKCGLVLSGSGTSAQFRGSFIRQLELTAPVLARRLGQGDSFPLAL